MAIIDSIVAVLVLYIISSMINKHIPEDKQIPKREHKRCTAIVSLILLVISIDIRVMLEFIWGYVEIFVIFTNDFLMLGILSIIFYYLYKKRIIRFGPIVEKKFFNSPFLKIYNIFIILIWIGAISFIPIPLLDIPINHPDVFELGFYWAALTVVINIVFTFLINNIRSIENRIPKQPLKYAMFSGGLISFGIWAIQLIVFELYLKRVFGIPLWEQDIRILIGVVTSIYIIILIVSLKKRFLPKAKEQSKTRVQKVLVEMKVQASNELDSVMDRTGAKELLNVKDLTTYFYTEEGVVHAVENVSFKVNEGEVLGLVGETGCGKSVTGLSILRLIRPPGKIRNGNVFFNGVDLLEKSEKEMLEYRGKDITMIFQDPLNSLNPVFKIGKQISEVFLLHMLDELLVEASKDDNMSIYSLARKWSIDLLKDLNIPHPEVIIDRYPHELSGGMRQRVQIAIGLACRPKLLVADEPTTALDVTIQNQILKLMIELHKKYKTTILFISHDFGIITKMCNYVAVMYSGSIVEYGKIQALFTRQYHPYTMGLIKSIPVVGKQKDTLSIIPGMVPNLIYPPSGCRFHPRCQYCFEPCESLMPKNIKIDEEYFVACHLYDPEYKELAEIALKKIEEIQNKTI
ncbi:MAG: ABC transporter ATP-binding protein [Promethearchaeota archaeon]